MEIDEIVQKYTLMNAIKYKGKANAKSTLGAIIQSNPQKFKSQIADLQILISSAVNNINKMSLEDQKALLFKIDPESIHPVQKKKKEVNLVLPNLENFDKVTLRLAPYPSGPLHIGNSRMVVLNDYLAKKYDGLLYLVFDDTIGSKTKIIDPESYKSIPEGLEFLDVSIHKTYYKSDRLELFYDYAVQILKRNEAYVCDCDAITWRTKNKVEMKPCKCRSLKVEENLSRWEKMLDGTYPVQGAVVRLKTGMNTPDPAIRDPVMLRISEREHPRVGTKYRVWPLLEYSWGIDDHELNISHIIRGKDLRKEGVLEEKIWDIFEWKKPTLHNLELSKSSSAAKIRSGEYTGWTDPRTWTLQSLKRRGITAEAIKNALLIIGMNPVDVTFSPEQIYSENRKLIDKGANRYFFTVNPINVLVTNIPSDCKSAHPLIHPEFPNRGTRTIKLQKQNNSTELLISSEDKQFLKNGEIIRLKDLMNVKLESVTNSKVRTVYHSSDITSARKLNATMIQWVPDHSAISTEILSPDGSYFLGKAESNLMNENIGNIIQFERFSFCRIEKKNSTINLIWTHK
ncbi:MAG: glutamate--tRNA ligase [Candidatus Hodarchaeales archaeon]|jgi:glutamyl-tRNA synthetase